jgi:subtilisin family serine protease
VHRANEEMMMAEIGPALAQRLEGAHDFDVFEVNIFLKGEPRDVATFDVQAADGAQSNVERIRNLASERQANLVGFLESQRDQALSFDDDSLVPQVRGIEQLWINNSVKAELSRDALEKVIAREDVEYVELVQRAAQEELFDEGDFLPRRRGVVALPHLAAFDGPAVAPPTWSVTRVNAPLMWQKGLRGEGVLVAVVDGGVNYRHPDLQARMWINPAFPNHGFDFENNNNDPQDVQGHGTCCAGIVAGDGSAGKATGVAPRARIMAIKVGGSETQFWQGMQFAITHGAHVISMSMTWKYPNIVNYPGWRRTCETILAAGLLHANSTGNQGDNFPSYPLPYNIGAPGNCPPPRLHPLQQPLGALSSPISCGATDSSDALAGYSGRGPAAWETTPFTDYPYANGTKPGLMKPDICAPGPGTESCHFQHVPGSSWPAYTSFGGTSSATPHVAGCLALLASACIAKGKLIVPARVQEAIENSAKRVVGQTRAKENHFGAGRIDVFAAYNYGVSKGWW